MLGSITRLIFTAVALALLAMLPAVAQITDVSPENKAVNAAIEKAKATLPVFFERLANRQPGEENFLIKIRYETTKEDGGGEHIWAKDVTKDGDSVSATIDNVPRNIPNLSKGQRVTVPISRVTDWLYEQNGKYRGAYTVRALVPFMTKQQAADMRKRLGPE